jgi:hypothetical protein
MKLYEISNLLEQTIAEYESYVDESGEIIEDTAELDARLETLQGNMTDKLINVALYIKNETAEADAIKEEIEKLRKRETSHRKRIDRLRGLIERYGAGQAIIDPRCEIKWRKSETVEISAKAEQLPARFQRVKIEIARDEIKKAIKAGEVFDYACLVEKQNLQIK